MVVDWQLSSYLPDHGGPHGTRYGYGKMVCGCVRACVCVWLVSKIYSTAPNLTKTQLQTAQKPPEVPCRTAHWRCIRLLGWVHEAAKQCISLSP